jgi:ATP-dependent DNA helicase
MRKCIICNRSHNWVDEYAKFAPEVSFLTTHLFRRSSLISFKIPVCMYNGTPAERAELRRTVMLLPGSKPKTTVSPKPAKKTTKIRKSTEAPTKRSPKPRNKSKQGSKLYPKHPK